MDGRCGTSTAGARRRSARGGGWTTPGAGGRLSWARGAGLWEQEAGRWAQEGPPPLGQAGERRLRRGGHGRGSRKHGRWVRGGPTSRGARRGVDRAAHPAARQAHPRRALRGLQLRWACRWGSCAAAASDAANAEAPAPGEDRARRRTTWPRKRPLRGGAGRGEPGGA